MKSLIVSLGCVLLVSGCVTPKIPDDVPPPPPARKGEPYAAPSLGGDEEEVEEGFGTGDGFGGDTPTMEVDASDLPNESATDDEDGDESAQEGDDEAEESTDKDDGADAPANDAKTKEPSEN